jgi:hypothetical protein
LVSCGTATGATSTNAPPLPSTTLTTAVPVSPPFPLPPTTSLPPTLPGGSALSLDPSLGYTLTSFRGPIAVNRPTVGYPPGLALRSRSSGLTIRSTLEKTGGTRPQYLVEPGELTSRGYANTPLSNGLEFGVLINGPERDVQAMVKKLQAASADIDIADPLGWLIGFLGSDWALVGDTRSNSDLFATESVASLQSGARTVNVFTMTPRKPIRDVLEVGLIYISLDVVSVNGVEELYQGPGAEGPPFAIVRDKSGMVATIEADTDPAGFAKLAVGLTAAPAADLAKRVGA